MERIRAITDIINKNLYSFKTDPELEMILLELDYLRELFEDLRAFNWGFTFKTIKSLAGRLLNLSKRGEHVTIFKVMKAFLTIMKEKGRISKSKSIILINVLCRLREKIYLFPLGSSFHKTLGEQSISYISNLSQGISSEAYLLIIGWAVEYSRFLINSRPVESFDFHVFYEQINSKQSISKFQGDKSFVLLTFIKIFFRMIFEDGWEILKTIFERLIRDITNTQGEHPLSNRFALFELYGMILKSLITPAYSDVSEAFFRIWVNCSRKVRSEAMRDSNELLYSIWKYQGSYLRGEHLTLEQRNIFNIYNERLNLFCENFEFFILNYRPMPTSHPHKNYIILLQQDYNFIFNTIYYCSRKLRSDNQKDCEVLASDYYLGISELSLPSWTNKNIIKHIDNFRTITLFIYRRFHQNTVSGNYPVKEIFKYLFFCKIFEYSLEVCELSLVASCLALTIIKEFIEIFDFRNYLHLVLEKFFLLVVMLKIKYNPDPKSYIHFYEYVIIKLTTSNCQDICYFKFLISPYFIYDYQDCRLDEITRNKLDKFYSLFFPEHKVIIEGIIKILGKRKIYENFLYLKFLLLYFSEPDNEKNLTENVKLSLSTLISNSFAEDKLTNRNSNFYSILFRELYLTIFLLLNKLNLKITEKYKKVKYESFMSFQNFFDYLSKNSIELVKTTDPSLSSFLGRSIVESYSYLSRKNLKRYIKDYLFTSSEMESEILINNLDPGLIELDQWRFFLSQYQKFLDLRQREYADRADYILDPFLLRLNDLVNYQDEDNYFLIMSLIKAHYRRNKILFFLIVQVLINPNDNQNKILSALEELFNYFFHNGSRYEIYDFVYALKLVESLFEDRQNFLVSKAKPKKEEDKKLYILKIGEVLNKPTEEEHSLDSIKAILSKLISGGNDYWTSLYNLYRAKRLWRRLQLNLDHRPFFNKLIIICQFKTCMAMIEQLVYREQIYYNIRDNNQYFSTDDIKRDYLILYHTCLTKLEKNSLIVKNFIYDHGLKNIFDSLGKKSNDSVHKFHFQQFRLCVENYFCGKDFSSNIVFSDGLDKNILKVEKKTDYILYTSYKFSFILQLLNQILLERNPEKIRHKINLFRLSFADLLKNKFLPESKNEPYSHFQEIYYEIWIVFESIVEHKNKLIELYLKRKKAVDHSPAVFQNTIYLLNKIFETSPIPLEYSNIIYFKVRRVFASMFELKKLELLQVESIVKLILQNQVEDDFSMDLIYNYLQIYLDTIKDSFHKPENLKEKLFYLEVCSTLKNKVEFDQKYYLFKQSYDTFPNEAYLFQLLLIRFCYNYDHNAYEDTLELVEHILNEDYNFLTINNLVEFTNKKYKFNEVSEGLCYILFERVILVEKSHKIEMDLQKELKDYQVIQTQIFSLLIIAVKSEDENLLFQTLPKLFNYIMRLSNLMIKSKKKEIFIFLHQITKFLTCDKIKSQSQLILHQLIDAGLAYSKETNIPLTDLAVDFISYHMMKKENLHSNAYWLTSFLISEFDWENGNMQENEKKFWRETVNRRKDFALGIYNKLDDISKKIIDNYKIFQESLKKIINETKNNKSNVDSLVKKEIERLNSLFNSKKLLIILPKYEYLSKNNNNYINNGMIVEEYENSYQMNNMVVNLNSSSKFQNGGNKSNVCQQKFISRIDEEFFIYGSKDRPVIMTFWSGEENFKFIIKKEVAAGALSEVRAMDVINSINSLFQKEKLDKALGLEMRLFSITPISLSSIIVEWVPDSQTLKTIVNEGFLEGGAAFRWEDLIKMADNFQRNYQNASKHLFETRSADNNVLYRSFHKNFKDPNKWYEAKKNYMISTALWSMTGWMIGIDDRHLENIILLNDGRVVHIDYGYLLRFGLKLGVPEVVSFRFTDNIRKNLGLFQQDGFFFFYCHEYVQCLLKNFDFIFTKLQALACDPIVEGGKEISGNYYMEEMKNLVIQTLETRGVLGQIRAKLRSSVFKIVDEQDQKSNIQMGCGLKWENHLLYKIKDTNVGGVISELIREFMEYLKMDYSLSVFIPECSISPERLKKDEILAKLGLSISNFNPNVPMLFFILHYFIDSIQSEPEKVYESLNKIAKSDIEKYSDENIMKNLYNYQANQFQEEDLQNQNERFNTNEENYNNNIDNNNDNNDNNNHNKNQILNSNENQYQYQDAQVTSDGDNYWKEHANQQETNKNRSFDEGETNNRRIKNEMLEEHHEKVENQKSFNGKSLISEMKENKLSNENLNQNTDDDIIEEIMIEDEDLEKSHDKKAQSSNNNFTISQSGQDGTVDSNALEEKYNYIEHIE